jgi:hypothetical protein
LVSGGTVMTSRTLTSTAFMPVILVAGPGQHDRARLLVVRVLACWALVIALVIGLIAFLVPI